MRLSRRSSRLLLLMSNLTLASTSEVEIGGYVPLSEAARRLGVTRQAVSAWVLASPEVGTCLIGDRRYVLVVDVEARQAARPRGTSR